MLVIIQMLQENSDLCRLIHKRKSCRAYLSGVNHQPTKVAILEGETKKHLSQENDKRYFSLESFLGKEKTHLWVKGWKSSSPLPTKEAFF